MAQHRRFLVITLLVALALRVAIAALAWTSYFSAPDDPGTLWRALEGAYAIAGGLGYVHGRKDTPASHDLEALTKAGEAGAWIGADDGALVSTDGMRPELVYPPGLPGVGGLLHRATSLPASTVIQTVGVAVDTTGVWFLFQLVLGIGFAPTLARRSAVAYAVFPPLVYGAGRLYAMNVMPALLLAATWLVMLAAKSTGRARWVRIIAAGLVIGFASYFRSDYLLYGIILGASLAFCKFSWRQAAAAAATLAGMAYLVLLPWAIRNYSVRGEFIFTSAAPAFVLYTGLGASSNPWGIIGTDQERWRELKEAGINDDLTAEANQLYYRKFRDAVLEHPGAYLGIVARRTVEAVAAAHDWGFRRPEGAPKGSDLRRTGDFSHVSAILAAHWHKMVSAVISLMGTIGCVVMYLCERRRRPLLALLLALPLYAVASHILTAVMPAYMLPAAPIQLVGLIYLVTGAWRAAPTSLTALPTAP
jgi:hypothetical protein